jgi:hypothetical protein
MASIEAQNRELLRRVRNIERALLTRPTDQPELLCRLAKNTEVVSDMKYAFRAQLKEITGGMVEMQRVFKSSLREIRAETRGKYKQKEHTNTRANLSNHETGATPPLCDVFYMKLENAKTRDKPQNFYGKESYENIAIHDGKKDSIYPPLFSFFLKKFLANPFNCCFTRKGDRCYHVKTDNDVWEKSDCNQEFWVEIREYLWDNYVRYVAQCSDEDDPDCFESQTVARMENMRPCEIPINKTGILHLLYKQKILKGCERPGQLLAKAYGSRNKTHY